MEPMIFWDKIFVKGRGVSEVEISHYALNPMGDWCRLEYHKIIEITDAGKGDTNSLSFYL